MAAIKNIKNNFKELLILLLCSSILILNFCCINSDDVYSVEMSSKTETEITDVFGRKDTYAEYIEQNKSHGRPDEEIIIEAADYLSSDGAQLDKEDTYLGIGNTLMWGNNAGSVIWEVVIPKAGFYNIEMLYSCLPSSARSFEFSLLINDESCFEAMTRLKLSRSWKDAREIIQDNRGNDIRASVVNDDRWLSESFSDKEGIYNDPYLFYFNNGENTIEIVNQSSPIALKHIRIYNQSDLPTYAEYSANIPQECFISQDLMIIQAEEALYKSDTILFPTYDRSNAATMPNDPVRLKLNTIGQSNWQLSGQFISWNIPVKEEGYYRIALRYRQNIYRGLTSYRRISVNGVVPFAEASAIGFPYNSRWQEKVLGNDNTDYLFLLKEGDNEIRMQVVPGPVGTISQSLEEISYTLNLAYRKIIMITGIQPDQYRDYSLEEDIPGLIESLSDARNRLISARDELLRINNEDNLTDNAVIINTMIVQLKAMIDRPDSISLRLTTFQSNLSSLADFINYMKQQPLEIDYFVIASPRLSEIFEPAGIFDNLIFQAQAFVGSFLTDYSSVGNTYSDIETVDVWINMGRDQVQVVKEMTDNMFTPENNIPVNVKLVQQGLVPAILSGRGPDVALFIQAGEPVNLACRNGLVALSDFEGFEEVTERFNPNALVPYNYKNKYYAIPLTESFPVMFCRTDIFDELDITPPETWDDFYRVLAILQRNNMTAGIPNMVAGNQMIINNSIYTMLLYQYEGQLYNSELSSTLLTTTEALQAFEMWTSLYSRYSLPVQYYFFQRFRTGEMPLGLENYTMYNMLTVAAPELKGLWEMYPVPGMHGPDNNINNTTIAGGSCAVMLATSNNKDNAWKYLSWFSNTEAQTQYGLNIEAVLGAAGRYDTANLEAFNYLPWTNTQKKLIRNEWNKIIELPQIPGSYYVDRNLTNAFRKVVFNNKNPRETLINYNRYINDEITRKRQEFELE